jgi:hypothetical protein
MAIAVLSDGALMGENSARAAGIVVKNMEHVVVLHSGTDTTYHSGYYYCPNGGTLSGSTCNY